MEIAAGVPSHEWQRLELDAPDSADWQVAVDILGKRITVRFLEPVDFLVNADAARRPAERKYGFTILAIDCLVIETLGAFLLGLENTDGQSCRDSESLRISARLACA